MPSLFELNFGVQHETTNLKISKNFILLNKNKISDQDG
jgi:hypothetical protein